MLHRSLLGCSLGCRLSLALCICKDGLCCFQPEARILHGVNVTRSRFLSRAQVIAAADFAAAAHAGQVRLTGDAYVVHVIKTAVIVEGLLANSARSFTLGER